MEFGLDQLRTGLRACLRYLDIRDSSNSSNLVADRFAAGLSEIPLRYPGRRPGRRLVASWNLAYHALSCSLAGLRQVCNQTRTCLRLA